MLLILKRVLQVSIIKQIKFWANVMIIIIIYSINSDFKSNRLVAQLYNIGNAAIFGLT